MNMPHIVSGEHLKAYTAMTTALDSLKVGSLKDTATRLACQQLSNKDALATPYDKLFGESIEAAVVRGAMHHMRNEPVELPTFEPVRQPTDRNVFETIAKAWLMWAADQDPHPLLQTIAKPTRYGGAIHLMALEPWGQAIHSLAAGDYEKSERLFQRSIGLSSQYGTPSEWAVNWTYAASFFHRGTNTLGV